MPKGKAAKGFGFGNFIHDPRAYRTVYQCDCGWACERIGGSAGRIIHCPVCGEPRSMVAIAGYKV